MEKVLYISKHNKQWKVHWKDESNGIVYTMRSLAVKRALRIASLAPEGQCTKVIIETKKGAQVIWPSENSGVFAP